MLSIVIRVCLRNNFFSLNRFGQEQKLVNQSHGRNASWFPKMWSLSSLRSLATTNKKFGIMSPRTRKIQEWQTHLTARSKRPLTVDPFRGQIVNKSHGMNVVRLLSRSATTRRFICRHRSCCIERSVFCLMQNQSLQVSVYVSIKGITRGGLEYC